jgi:hypothetical protein
MNTEHQQPDDESLQAPPALVAALKQLPPAKVPVPPALDETIFRAAKEHLEDRRRVVSLPFVRRSPWLAIAASLMILGTALYLFNRPATVTPLVIKFAREDINQDGQVDILDALALSLKLEEGRVSADKDLNGDGVIDAKDAEAIAQKSVQLTGGHRS